MNPETDILIRESPNADSHVHALYGECERDANDRCNVGLYCSKRSRRCACATDFGVERKLPLNGLSAAGVEERVRLLIDIGVTKKTCFGRCARALRLLLIASTLCATGRTVPAFPEKYKISTYDDIVDVDAPPIEKRMPIRDVLPNPE